MIFRDKKCACDTGNVQKLTAEGIEKLLKEVEGWKVVDNHHLSKEYRFKKYPDQEFVDKLIEIANEQNHHPDIYLAWGKARVEIYTHVVNGLTDNDFILAAKYDAIKK